MQLPETGARASIEELDEARKKGAEEAERIIEERDLEDDEDDDDPQPKQDVAPKSPEKK